MQAGLETGAPGLASFERPWVGPPDHCPNAGVGDPDAMSLIDIITAAQDAVLTLNRSDASYALCGGLALAAYGAPRNTWDVDVVVDDENDVQRALTALTAADWACNPDTIDFPDGFRLRRLFKRFGDELAVLDLLRSPPGWTCTQGRVLTDLQGAACWVVAPAVLKRMKQAAGRPQDLLDLQSLENLGHGR